MKLSNTPNLCHRPQIKGVNSECIQLWATVITDLILNSIIILVHMHIHSLRFSV